MNAPSSPTLLESRGRGAATDKGALARERLITEATRVFAAKGYAAASTREICDAAQANLASIHYYFGDKEGLYRAVLARPIEMLTRQFQGFDREELSFAQSMRLFLGAFLTHYVSEAEEAMVLRLHLREMLEPSSVFRDLLEGTIFPHHQALVTLLARHCHLKRPDTDLHQLAFAIVAMAYDYCVSRECMKVLAPDVLARRGAAALILDRLVGYSEALLAHEIARRGGTLRAPIRDAARVPVPAAVCPPRGGVDDEVKAGPSAKRKTGMKQGTAAARVNKTGAARLRR